MIPVKDERLHLGAILEQDLSEESDFDASSHIVSSSAAMAEKPIESASYLSGFMSTLAQPFHWVQSGLSTVKRAVELYRRSDLTLGRITELLRDTKVTDYQTALSLAQDYSRFKGEKKSCAMTHDQKMDEQEKRALDLYNRRGKLSPVEEVEFKELLQVLHQKQVGARAALYRDASQLIELIKLPPSATRHEIQAAATELLLELRGRPLTIEDYSVIELAVSKILLKAMDAKAEGPQVVSFLAATYQEHNRLKPLCETFTGEDFFRVKVEQLQFLFEGLEHFQWNLTFVEDEPRGDSPRTIDVMREMMGTDPQLQQCRGQVFFLDYQEDLGEEIAMYQDKETAQMDGDTFARSSVKGGAIQVGLRYLAQVQDGKQYKTPRADFILYTDCDTSVNLGNTGILLNQIVNQGRDIAIGSRRIEGAHVIGKSAERHLQSFLFNTLVRVLLNVQVTDTQVGAKAFRPEAIRKVHQGFSERSMAFDPEIFRLASKEELTVGEDGIV
ncbi:MAG: hypothetical protein KDK64_04515, partial [Chlamydiia bacterium]|nr:hypothetical protein [Chlamydiia bacterium]